MKSEKETYVDSGFTNAQPVGKSGFFWRHWNTTLYVGPLWNDE